jgi:ribonuclease G
MAKELIVSVNGREKKIAIVEDDLVTEFYVERGDENQGIVGNIYKGRVMKVLPGMQSAFVDIGLERDSFLYVSDFLDEEEMEDTGPEERREVIRAPRPDRPRPPREVMRQEVAAPVVAAVELSDGEADEEKEADLRMAALSHIEELAEEPAVEMLPDDEAVEGASLPTATGRVVTSRQRRQRRLTYQDEVPAPAPVVELETGGEESPAVEKGAVEARTDGEEEYSGRRRRRPRRRRTSDVMSEESAPGAGEELEAQLQPVEEEVPAVEATQPKEPAARVPAKRGDRSRERRGRVEVPPVGIRVGSLTPMVIAHHEPLERVVDEEVGALEGEMLKDALLQDRISNRIHAEERRVSLVDVEPTPEVKVGSWTAPLEEAGGLERIVDEVEPIADNVVTPPAAVTEKTSREEATTEEGATVIEPLEDGEAELLEKPRSSEFATRRGGRGRRRSYRPRSGEDSAEDGKSEEGGEEEEAAETSAAPAPLPPLHSRPERYQRPVISDLLREGQEIIVQIAKEPIGQKGARITSHVALPGRYIVYMPTVEHIGVSRKIGTDEERQRLKRTLHQLRAETGATGGFIVRTAAHGCSLEELREDMQYLVRTWTDIRRRSERVKAASIVHRDLDLVQRILRDQLSTDFTAIRVDNEFEYERIVDFVNRFAPKLVNRVKLYTRETPILEHYGVQAEIDKAVKPRVWLKSGGYIVINQTEALVAIDVNTGKFVGRSNRLEDTIVKTNLEAAKEIVRQIRLRDLGGIIVLDFIDMEERRNRQKVMQALEVELRSDRSPSKILQFNDFGLVAITRKRVKQSLERTLCTPCSYCGGAGMVKSAQTICYEILAESRRVSKSVDSHNEVILRVNPEVAKALRTSERDILAEVETYLGGIVTIKSDPTVHQEQFDIAVA